MPVIVPYIVQVINGSKTGFVLSLVWPSREVLVGDEALLSKRLEGGLSSRDRARIASEMPAKARSSQPRCCHHYRGICTYSLPVWIESCSGEAAGGKWSMYRDAEVAEVGSWKSEVR